MWDGHRLCILTFLPGIISILRRDLARYLFIKSFLTQNNRDFGYSSVKSLSVAGAHHYLGIEPTGAYASAVEELANQTPSPRKLRINWTWMHLLTFVYLENVECFGFLKTPEMHESQDSDATSDPYCRQLLQTSTLDSDWYAFVINSSRYKGEKIGIVPFVINCALYSSNHPFNQHRL